MNKYRLVIIEIIEISYFIFIIYLILLLETMNKNNTIKRECSKIKDNENRKLEGLATNPNKLVIRSLLFSKIPIIIVKIELRMQIKIRFMYNKLNYE